MSKKLIFIIFFLILGVPTVIVDQFSFYPFGYDYTVADEGIEIQELGMWGNTVESHVTKTWGNLEDAGDSKLIVPHHAIKEIQFWYFQLSSIGGLILASVFLLMTSKKSFQNQKVVYFISSILLLSSVVLLWIAINMYPQELVENLNQFIKIYQLTTS